MSRIIQIQNDFTSGEMDPKLRARTDLKQYKSGLSQARNVSIQPQGGATRRDGTLFLHQLDSGAADAVVHLVDDRPQRGEPGRHGCLAGSAASHGADAGADHCHVPPPATGFADRDRGLCA